MKKLKNIGKTLSNVEQKQINGGMEPSLIRKCTGTGTGGVSSVGHSSACIGYSGKCTINEYLAACTGVADHFWFY